MLLLGLTGSIATGKSSVSNILREPPYSLPIIDADVLARKVVEPGTPGYTAIVRHFAPLIPDLLLPESECGGPNGPSGNGRPLNRPALGRHVFGDAEDSVRERKVLNGIVHPAVRKEIWKSMAKAYFSGAWAVVLDIPLLFESGWEPFCGTIMVVAVTDPVVQMRRLRERDPHLTEDDARKRVLSQTDVREKAARAEAKGKGRGVVVWNDGDKDELKREVERVMTVVRNNSPRWWGWLLLLCPPFGATVALWNYFRGWTLKRRWSEEKKREKAKL
ncbi:CoaE-domain-containing protein [Patellaria atrata CBS 101060]|uniref:CoaE-domain-containing protein n=1 Tax=Patellaria atrata CBS 101060 TaxID=1346257 RepID=A0A9P4VRV9_9PEZI|nr:CoaE-domain-containing protein [Patellaria atrata CBS 101060]